MNRSTVVVDTLNGLYGVAGGNVRRADTALKMLAMAARHTASRIIVACIAERRGDEAWRLLPGGTRLAAAGGGDAAWRRLVRCGGPGRRGTIALEPIAPWDSRRGGAAGGAIDAGAPGLALPRTGQPA